MGEKYDKDGEYGKKSDEPLKIEEKALAEVYGDQKRYTYADYCSWDEDERCEIIDGLLYMMAQPTRKHQEITGEIYRQLANFLKGKPCRVFISPFCVRLNHKAKDDTVVEPDVLVVCDESKLDDSGCNGAPDLVIEVLSPSTADYDKSIKYNKYKEHGVREYWIVDPVDNNVTIHLFKKDRPAPDYCIGSGTIYVHILKGCMIDLRDLLI